MELEHSNHHPGLNNEFGLKLRLILIEKNWRLQRPKRREYASVSIVFLVS